jgi:hypothetical protein
MEYEVMVKATPEVTLESAPDMVMEGSVFTVEWMIANANGGEVTHTAVHWDNASQGTPLDHTDYANMVTGEMGMTEGHYHANVTAPDMEGTVYFVVHAIINGMDFYAAMEYMVTVYETPSVTLVMAPSTVVVDGTALIEWTVTSPSPEDVTHTAVHWDTTSHGEPLDFNNYPNALMGMMGDMAGEYHVNMTAPEGPTTVYFIVHAIVMDVHYYAGMEYMIEVVDEPVVTLEMAPEAVFVDGMAMFEWSIMGADADDITHTAIHWDTTSHGEPLDFMNYPNAIAGEMGMMDGHYHANMTAPSTPVMVYYILHAIVMDEHYYAEMEYMLDVKAVPAIDSVMFDDKVFTEGTVTVMWNVSMVALEDVTHTAVHWDTTSFGTPLDFTDYANMVEGMDGSPVNDYKAMFTAPATSGSVFFVVHAIIMDEHFYAVMEYEVMVMEAPVISLVQHTGKVFVDGTAMFWWDIDGVDAADVAHTAVHWDTSSHANGDMDHMDYPNMLLGEDGGEDSDYMASMDAPGSPATVYFVVHAIVMGHDFYAGMEYMVMVVDTPTVSLVAKSDYAYLGEEATVWWDVDGAAEEDLTHTAVHWDTTSHAGGEPDFNAYANMVLGGDGAPDSDFIATFDVPEDPFKVYIIVHAIVLGEDFYAEMEYSIDVFPEPDFNNIVFKEKVKAGDEITVRFTIGTNTSSERISHVGVHWDTISHGEPLDFNKYANAETVEPNINGVYAVTFNVPEEAGTVYFVIHSIIDGNHFYAEDTESMVTVEEKADEGGLSTTTLIAVAVVVIILLAIMAFAMMNRGGSEE